MNSSEAHQELVARAVARAHTEEWAYVLAATVRVTRDLDLAEDCVQDAYTQALIHWSEGDIPQRPGAWLTTVARRRALEQHRRAATLARKLPLLITDDPPNLSDASGDGTEFPDDRLRLIFTCCHPALSKDAQLALTLRLVCGLTSAEVARAFLVKEATMQARITRAKQKIAAAGIPYRVPGPDELAERVGVVLDAIHLLYSSGYTAASGEELVRGDLAARALDLATMMHALMPGEPEVMGLLALLQLTEARRPARVSANGELILMEDQDRSLWDQQAIESGCRLVHDALSLPAARPTGRYVIMAAIGAVHSEVATWDDTDWPQLVGLYDLLYERWPTPVVALNRAVAVSFVDGPVAALRGLDDIHADSTLAAYPYLAATRADLFRRLGRTDAALSAYREALRLTNNAAEAAFLQRRIDILESTRNSR